jgi:Glutamine amidotransferases class-II
VSKGGQWLGEPRISDVDRDRRLGDASAKDSGFMEAIRAFDLSGPGVLVAHLRRRGSGDICNRNTHPYRDGKYVFCHNGVVPWLANEDRDAPSDSARNDTHALFQRVLDKVRHGSSEERALLGTVAEVHQRDSGLPSTEKYSSLTSVLSDGHTSWVVRDVNLSKEPGKPEYPPIADRLYTMFLAEPADLPGVAIACQEPIPLGAGSPPAPWDAMGPLELAVIRNGVVVKREPIPA